MGKGPDEGGDKTIEKQKNFVYDYSALAAYFQTGTYRKDFVKRSLDQYKAVVEAKAGLAGAEKIVTRFPGIDGNVDLKAVTQGVEDDFDMMYQEREPYIIAGIMYFSIMQRAEWDFARFVAAVKHNVDFVDGMENGEYDGGILQVQVEGSMQIPMDLYIAACRKLDQELEEVRGIMRRCQGQIPPLDRLLEQEMSNLGAKGGLVN